MTPDTRVCLGASFTSTCLWVRGPPGGQGVAMADRGRTATQRMLLQEEAVEAATRPLAPGDRREGKGGREPHAPASPALWTTPCPGCGPADGLVTGTEGPGPTRSRPPALLARTAPGVGDAPTLTSRSRYRGQNGGPRGHRTNRDGGRRTAGPGGSVRDRGDFSCAQS